MDELTPEEVERIGIVLREQEGLMDLAEALARDVIDRRSLAAAIEATGRPHLADQVLEGRFR